MKNAKSSITRLTRFAVATALLFGIGLLGVRAASGQSLGDYAREARKKKPDAPANVRHFDNDNLPTDQALSVVGPPAAEANSNDKSAAPPDPAAARTDRQKAADEWNKRISTQQAKIDRLAQELDLDQREYRLRAAAFYADAGNRLRDPGDWDKQDAQYKSDIDAKQKAIETARQQLSTMEEQARKAGVKESDGDKDKSAGDKDSGAGKTPASDAKNGDN